jgi:hypothetical protein
MIETFDAHRKMFERPDFARSVDLTHELLNLVEQQQYGESVFSRDFNVDELFVVHGLATAHAEIMCARFDLPDAGRTTITNPQPKYYKTRFKPYNSLDPRVLPSPETAIF